MYWNDKKNGLPESPDETTEENEMAEMTDLELFKRALVEGVNRHFQKIIDSYEE